MVKSAVFLSLLCQTYSYKNLKFSQKAGRLQSRTRYFRTVRHRNNSNFSTLSSPPLSFNIAQRNAFQVSMLLSLNHLCHDGATTLKGQRLENASSARHDLLLCLDIEYVAKKF